MSEAWDPNQTREPEKISLLGWCFVALRAPLIFVIVFGGLLILLLIRQIERPFFGAKRPITPWITQTVCRSVLRVMSLPLYVSGKPMKSRLGVIVANHASWLDIFVLNSRKNIYFVSKAEVASWPGIGWLARATGTVFIKRERSEAKKQTQLFQDRLELGHRLLFFPEGTSTDAQRILPFKTTLFQAFLSDELKKDLAIQAVTVVYHAPATKDPRFYGWWGDMGFGPSLLSVLAQPRQGAVELVYHTPVPVAEFENRKSLAAKLEAQMRSEFKPRLQRGLPDKSTR